MRKLVLLLCTVILSLSAFAQTDKIFYTSTDGNIVTPYKTDVFGANIISNEYTDGQGVITFDGPVKNIGNQAFYFRSSLNTLTIPEGVTSIGRLAFYRCSSLTTITIPGRVTNIGIQAFISCSKLDTIYVEATTPPTIGSAAFNSSPVCIIPCGIKAVYESSDWARYIKEFIVEQFEIAVHSNNDTWGTVTIDVPIPSPGIGTFSVSATKQVTFSPGNLQYTQSTDTWSFAENQYDYIGTDNVIGGTVSSNSFGDSILGTALADKVDLFGLSTSTTNFGVSISIDSENDYSGSFIDWGTNKIGNDAPNTWRTLTYEEWNYLCWVRPNYSELCGVAHCSAVND